MNLDELEARVALLTEAFDTIQKLDEAKGIEPVTASGGSLRGDVGGGIIPRMISGQGGVQRSPSAQSQSSGRVPVTVTAALTAANSIAGSPIPTSVELAELTCEALRRLGPGVAPEPRRAVVASARWEYPPERQLTDDVVANTAKIDDVCGLSAPRVDRSTGAVVASGGICLPVNADFTVPTWSTADRPLRDGLPSFQATRGGVRYMTPPDLGVPSLQATASGAGTSVTVWTEATDANPAGATKPVWVVGCGEEQLVYVNAIPTCVQTGNMQSRFMPEFVAANTQMAISVSAREAELELLTLMASASGTKSVEPASYLGATRDLLSSVDLLISQFRYSHRIPRTMGFCAVFPDWARDLVRADLARESAHDNAGSINVLGISDGEIDNWFVVRGINVIWTLDALKSGTYGNVTVSGNQFFPILTSGTGAPAWPNTAGTDSALKMSWLLFPEGTFQFLDGGRLDLGVVRDSLLDGTNDYETFVEVFEGLAFRGLEAYCVQSNIFPNGGSAGTVAVSSYAE